MEVEMACFYLTDFESSVHHFRLPDFAAGIAGREIIHFKNRLRSDRPPAVPKRPRQERPQPTRANPFHEPGEVPPAIVEINLSLGDGEEPADPPALSS
jgi:hypothetical protein